MGAKRRLVVIGGDAGGMSAAAIARRRDPDLEIVAFERGPYTSYSACGVPYYVGGWVAEAMDLVARTPARFERDGIHVRMGWEVVEIDLDRRTVVARQVVGDGSVTERFDELMYATGAEAVIPPIPGAAEATEPLRTIPAGERFRQRLAAEESPKAVVVGAGYIGLETAEALAHRGYQVTLVEGADQVFGTVDPDMAEHVERAATNAGIDVRLGVKVEAIEHEDGMPRAVVTSDETFEATHVILSVGARPATDLAKAAGLPLGDSGGIVTDDHQRVIDGVWAAGDCVECWHRLLEKPVNIQLGTHANKQGRVAGMNMTGADVAFAGVIGTAASRICAAEVARTGISEKEAKEAGIEVAVASIEALTRAGYYPGTKPIHIKATAEPGSGRLLGAQIVGGEGSAKRIDVFATAIWTGMTAEELAGIDLSYAPPFSGVFDPVLIAARQVAKEAAKLGAA